MARRYGRRLVDVFEDPYALTLWTFGIAQDEQEIERIKLEGLRLDMAGLVAVAFHEPDKLEKLEYTWKDKARLLPTRAQAIERGKALIARITSNGGFH